MSNRGQGQENKPMSENATPVDKCGAKMVDPKLLEILVCPLTKGPLRYDDHAN